jgi:hypothetical protein
MAIKNRDRPIPALSHTVAVCINDSQRRHRYDRAPRASCPSGLCNGIFEMLNEFAALLRRIDHGGEPPSSGLLIVRNVISIKICLFQHCGYIALLWEMEMAKTNLASMSVDALLKLRDDVGEDFAVLKNAALRKKSKGAAGLNDKLPAESTSLPHYRD